jgi:AcrR family transcriptional regulator
MSSTTRRRNPRGEGARLREPLIEAAVALIDESGDISKVSVRAITRRAGVSPTALYLHFPDRDSLVDAAVDAGFAAFNAAILEAAAGHADPRRRLFATGVAYLAFAQRQPALYSVIFGSGRPRSRLAEPSVDAVDRSAAFDALVEAVAAALRDDRDAAPVAIGWWSSLHGFAMLRASDAPVEFPSGDAFVQRLLDAYF